MASGCTHEEASLIFLDNLDNISVLLDEDNVWKKKLFSYLLNEVSKYSYFIILIIAFHFTYSLLPVQIKTFFDLFFAILFRKTFQQFLGL